MLVLQIVMGCCFVFLFLSGGDFEVRGRMGTGFGVSLLLQSQTATRRLVCLGHVGLTCSQGNGL